MKLRLLPLPECPPDKYRYTFPQDGHTVFSFSKSGWFDEIAKHYRRNQYEMPDDWKEIAEDQLCRLLPPGWCEYPNGGPLPPPVDARIQLDDIMRGTKVFVEFVRQGAPLVDRATAEERGRTCAACYMKASIPGCGACVGVANLVAEATGAQGTKADVQLEGTSCLVCKCSSKAQIWMTKEVLRPGVTREMMDQFPAEFCWKRKLFAEEFGLA